MMIHYSCFGKRRNIETAALIFLSILCVRVYNAKALYLM
jgi:hypothetical protein